MTRRRIEESKRELARHRSSATADGMVACVRHSFDGQPFDPPTFFRTLPEAEAEAIRVFTRLDTACGPDLHARPGDMKQAEVWIERVSNGEWTRFEETVRRGTFDTSPRRTQRI